MAIFDDFPGGASTALAAWLRGRVLRLRQDSNRRNFPHRLELVRLSPSRREEPALVTRAGTEQADDHALRVELLNRMLAECELSEPLASAARQAILRGKALVHVRAGPPEPCDSDIAWAAAARCQAGITALQVERVFAVTRWGWLDVASGERRTWVRLRA